MFACFDKSGRIKHVCKGEKCILSVQNKPILKGRNDRVEIFDNPPDSMNYLRECRRVVLFIIDGQCTDEYLCPIHRLM